MGREREGRVGREREGRVGREKEGRVGREREGRGGGIKEKGRIEGEGDKGRRGEWSKKWKSDSICNKLDYNA